MDTSALPEVSLEWVNQFDPQRRYRGHPVYRYTDEHGQERVWPEPEAEAERVSLADVRPEEAQAFRAAQAPFTPRPQAAHAPRHEAAPAAPNRATWLLLRLTAAALAERSLVWAALTSTASLFGYAVYEPELWRFITATVGGSILWLPLALRR